MIKRDLGILVTLFVALGVADAMVDFGSMGSSYFTRVGSALVGVIVAVILLAAFLVGIILRLAGLMDNLLLKRRYQLHLGFNLLKSHKLSFSFWSKVKLMYGTWLGQGRWTVTRAIAALVVGTGLVVAGRFVSIASFMVSLPMVRLAGWADTGVTVAGIVLASYGLYGLVWGIRHTRPSTHRRLFDKGRMHKKARRGATLPTFISIVGVAIGVWALIVVLSVMGGFQNDLKSKIIRNNPHLMVEHLDPTVPLADPGALTSSIEALPGVAAVHQVLTGEAMIASPTNINVNLSVFGLAPEAGPSTVVGDQLVLGSFDYLDDAASLVTDRTIHKALVSHTKKKDDGGKAPLMPILGQDTDYAPQSTFPGIIIGSELAKSLQVSLGSEVQLISPEGDIGPMGIQPKSRTFAVAGIFSTGMYEYDLKYAYLALDDSQAFFSMPGVVNRLEIWLSSMDATDATYEGVEGIIAGLVLDDPPRVMDWRSMNKSLFSALALEKIAMFIILGFIILVASFNIVSSLIMLILDKSREIAILKAMGSTRREILTTFMSMGVFIGFIGSLSGLTLGLLTCIMVQFVGLPLPKEYYIKFIPVEVNGLEVAVIVLAAMVISLLATIYPSMKAAGIHPVEGLRYEQK